MPAFLGFWQQNEQKPVIMEIMKAMDAIIANGEELDGQKEL
jgi:hypothetical protein